MSKLKDISFRHKGSGNLYARIKVGGEWGDHPMGHRTVEEATPIAIALRDELQAKWAKDHPEAVAQSAAGQPQQPPPSAAPRSVDDVDLDAFPKGTIMFLVKREFDAKVKRRNLRSPGSYYSAMKHLAVGLGSAVGLEPSVITRPMITKLRDYLATCDAIAASVAAVAQRVRDMLRMMIPHGFDALLIDELKNLTAQEPEVGGEAFLRHHLRAMLAVISIMSEVIQILFWIGMSGGPQIVDAVFLPFAAVSWETGLISYRRIKSRELIRFGALPPLLELLKRRRERLGQDAVYVLPELIFLCKELRDPRCNHAGWRGFHGWRRVPKKVVNRGVGKGIGAINVLLKAAGIKTEGLTYKSFRRHDISLWSSIGLKLKTRMAMAGHTTVAHHERYDTAPENEILRARDIVWRYCQAMEKGEDFFVPATAFDIYERLNERLERLPDITRASLAQELVDLRKENDELRAKLDALREQVATQDGRLQAVLDLCGRLAAHFGIGGPSARSLSDGPSGQPS